MRVREFTQDAVTVTEPIIVNAYMKEREYLCSLDMDKLLAGFRETAGIPKRAERYPRGWEQTEFSGHTLGHYMVALAQVYAKEKSGEIKERLEYILSELSQSQKQSGYLFTSESEVFDKLEQGATYKPWYTMHKIVTGLTAVYRLTGMEQALTIVKKLGDWILDRVLNWTPKQKRWALSVADGGMNDCLYELYKITGDKRYADAAEKFDEPDLFAYLAMGKDVLSNKNAADTIPKILGALNRYVALGESEAQCLETAKNFFDMVIQGHTYVTGGNGELMHFRAAGALAEYRNQYNSETCSTYGMMTLAEELYFVTGDKKYMDYYEQAYFNAMLGAQNPESGMTAFYQPMATGYFKTFSDPVINFWCCTGTGMESFTNLSSNIYHANEEEIYVNLYISSVLEDKKSGLKLTQMVDAESYESAEFVLEAGKLENLSLSFRVPEWCGKDIDVTVNGTAVKASVKNGYLTPECKWKKGDRIVLQFYPEIRLNKLPDMEYCVAMTYGPFVLAAGLGDEDMTTERTRHTHITIATKNVAVQDRIVLQEGLTRTGWLANCKENFVKKDGELAFSIAGIDADRELVFKPYYKIYNERYGIYFEYYDEENLPDDLRAIKEEQKRLEEERLAAEAEAARLAEEERLRQEEEERKRKEEERMRREAERQRQEEEERKIQEEERKRREEDYRLRRGIELQRQEFQRRLEAEAEERERREDEERKRRAEEERKRHEEERRLAAEAENSGEEASEPLESNMARRLRMEEEARRRREEAEAAEAERRRQEEEKKRREEDYRLRQEFDKQRQELGNRCLEGDDDRARRETEEAERKRKEEARKRREEEYRLFRERELQRQELERHRLAEEEEALRKKEEEEARRKAEEEEARRLAEEEEARRMAEEEEARRLAEEEEARRKAEEEEAERQRLIEEEEARKRAEEEERELAAKKIEEAKLAAELAEAKLREEEARLLLAKLAAERAKLEATMKPAEPESEASDKKKGGLKGLFGGKKR